MEKINENDYKVELYQKFYEPFDINKNSNLICKGALIVLKSTGYYDNRIITINSWIFTNGKDLYDFLVNVEIPSIEEDGVISEFDYKTLNHRLESVIDNPGGFVLHYDMFNIRWVLSIDYVRVLTGK